MHNRLEDIVLPIAERSPDSNQGFMNRLEYVFSTVYNDLSSSFKRLINNPREWFKTEGKLHVLESTAWSFSSLPITAAYETQLAGYTLESSLILRIIGIGDGFLGITKAIVCGRKLWRQSYNLEKTSQTKQCVHDGLYATIFHLFPNLILYTGMSLHEGSLDFEKIGIATFCAAALHFVQGLASGYVLDNFKDFAGYENSSRVPTWLKTCSAKTKRTLIGAIIPVSVALTAAVYSLPK